VVPGEWAAHCPPHDAHEHGFVQRARGGVSAVGSLLRLKVQMMPAGADCVSAGRLGLFGPKETDGRESRRSMQEDSARRLSFLHRNAQEAGEKVGEGA
jgi:hypothetical protein